MGRGRRALESAAVLAGVLCANLAVAAAAGPTSTPDDAGFRLHEQWGLAQAGFPTAWCRSTGAGALIVVVDTGVDAAHPDLAGKIAGQARIQDGQLTAGPGSAADDSGHGTHVAGIAAAVTNNTSGIAGAAPDAKLWAIKVLFSSSPGKPEQGTQTDLVQAIDYATDTVAASWAGPVVLNISIGGADSGSGTQSGGTVDTAGDALDQAIDHAYSRGLAVALAAGNSGSTPVGTGAVQAGEALSVGALDENGAVAPYSPASGVSIFAAGGAANAQQTYTSTGILSTWLQSSAGDYAWLAGTSMAAPHVAAALALLMSTGMTNQQAYDRLLATADAQRRMHVDLALGSTTPCGGPTPAPHPPAAHHPPAAAAATAPRPVTHTAAAPPPPPSPAAPATQSPVPTPTAMPPLAATQVHMFTPPASHPAQPAASGRAWLTRGALGGGALLLVRFVTPRRLLRRRRG